MKKIMILVAAFLTSFVFGQNLKPKYEKIDDNLVKGTFYHQNGEIQQQGFYIDGKLHGKWESFNSNGDKVASGNYKKGIKTGKWLFWDGTTLSEVSYNNNTIASVKEVDKKSNVAVNFRK